MNIDEYLSGERLQELTDYTIVIDNKQGNKLALSQLPNTNCKYEIVTSADTISKDIMNADSLFVYTQGVSTFFNTIFPKLKKPITLMSHNSDVCIYDNRYDSYLNSDMLVKWFAQNVNYKHEKLIPIPIGIANSQWEHGNISLIDEIRKQNNEKTHLVYNNFNCSTAPGNRTHVAEQLQRNGILRNQPSDNKTYLTQLAKSIFCICPFGAGYDSHRVWEALYLNTIPVVPECVCFKHFDKLPILHVSDWSKITPEYLNAIHKEMANKEYDYKSLTLGYWKEQLKSCMV